MFKTLLPVAAVAALISATSLPAVAADIIYEPPVYELPPPEVIYKEVDTGGWYIRGDIDYHQTRFRGAKYVVYPQDPADFGTGAFDWGKLRGGFSAGAGVGYQVNRHFRTDLTADYWFRTNFRGQTSGVCFDGDDPFDCSSIDTAKFSALLLLANAYAELGTYKRITPYVGAGIGGAHVRWGNLRNQIPDVGIDVTHSGWSGWRFAYALMAGASYCITNNWHADIGYRYSHIMGGRMFEATSPSGEFLGAGPGFDRGLSTHEVRAGLRYQFGGPDRGCDPVKVVSYEPEDPIWPPVYK